MTDTDLIMTAVSTIGFPIVAFFAMYQMCNTTIKANTAALENLKAAITGGAN